MKPTEDQLEAIEEQEERVEEEGEKLEAMGGSLRGQLASLRDSAFERFPIAFVMLSSFGLVATLYGFEKLIDSVPFFVENPNMILVTGIAVLLLTGALYKKLS